MSSFFPRPATVSTYSLVFGYLPIVPLALAAIVVWFAGPTLFAVLIEGAVLWSAILFFFLAGVRRGLSSFTEGGPQPAQLLTMFWLFAVGLIVLASPYATFAVAMATAGFASLVVFDPRAARRAEVPEFFRTVRPPQMGLAALAMISILLSIWL